MRSSIIPENTQLGFLYLRNIQPVKERRVLVKLGVAMPPSGPTPGPKIPPVPPGTGLSSWEPDREQHHLSLALALGVKIN